MPKPRIPLPKQTEQVHRADTDYDRRREQQVSLDEVYADPANQPGPLYLAGLRRLQVAAVQESSLEELNQGNHDQDHLEIFLASDQPEVCRYCGKIRTDFSEVGGRQLHTCPECGRSYWVEED